jgi:hypothetical protein
MLRISTSLLCRDPLRKELRNFAASPQDKKNTKHAVKTAACRAIPL